MQRTWKNVTIIGTSHIAAESVKQIRKVVAEQKPDCICVELDRDRYAALLRDEKPKFSFALIRRVGFTGYLFALIGRGIQKRLGDIVGMQAGSDMKTAIELAQETKTRLYFIDQHIEETLKDLSKKFTFREKVHLFKDALFPPNEAKAIIGGKTNLRTVPADTLVRQIILLVQKRYPGLYEALIGKRNRHMARKLFLLQNEPAGKRILAVMGAGHLEGVLAELEHLERTIDIIHPPRSMH